MIGNLVVVKGCLYNITGVVITDFKNLDMVEVRVLHFINNAPPNPVRTPMKLNETYCASKHQIIKKSSRPVKMKPQLSLKDQQPITL